MRTIIGIDYDGDYKAALHAYSKLAFREPHIELIHVEPSLMVGGLGGSAYTYANYSTIQDALKRDGEQLLGSAQSELNFSGYAAETLYVEGRVCETILERADETHADLIVVGSSHKSPYGAFFLGSIGRGLTLRAHHSLLISKHDTVPTGKFTAVFATDGSDYADECLRMLVRMRPQGIGRLAVVTAVDHLEDGRPPRAIKDHVDRLVGHLRDECIEANGHVVEGSVPRVIDTMMESTGAELLIMGAQGHGFVERLVVGSVSLQEVVASPHSVLLLRTR